MNSLQFKQTFQYQLTYREAYDASYLLASRQSRRTKFFLGVCLTAISVFLLILFAMDGRRVQDLFLALIAVMLLFYLIYHPVLCARKGARNVERINGMYKVTVTGSGQFFLPDGQSLQFGKDKYARAVETDTVFALRIDRQNTLCIPKRILKASEVCQIRQMLQKTFPNARYKVY